MEFGLLPLDHPLIIENLENSGFFPKGKETSLRKAEFENNLRTDIKLCQKSLNINTVVSSSPIDFEGLRRLMAFGSCESQTEAHDCPRTENQLKNHAWKGYCRKCSVFSKIYCSFTRLEQILSINFKFNGIFVPFLKREKTFIEEHRINFKFVINILKSFSFVPWGKICHKNILTYVS